MAGRAFDPVFTSRHIARSYREYLASTVRFGDVRLQQQLEEILSRPGFLSKGPFLEATPPYTKAESVRQLVARGVLCEGMLTLGEGNPDSFDPDIVLYEHQVKALEMAKAGKNYIVTTGTGSGKTECFVLPILDDILREQEEHGPSAGVRAMILYPMNALANDQLKRLRKMLAGTSVTFGRYVGDTPESRAEARNAWKNDHAGETPLPNELLSREEMRQTPPNILLTNYSMLEYLLLRPKDAAFFSSAFGAGWRHIAIDEAHVYSGTLGTEIAYLLRRLKTRVEQSTGKRMNLHCYATSATMGTDKDRPQIAKFAEDLFGEPFDHGENPAVIGSRRDDPMGYFRKTMWGSLSPTCWEPLRDAILEDELSRDTLRSILSNHVPDAEFAGLMTQTPKEWLSELLLGDENSRKIVARVTDDSRELFDLTDIDKMRELGIEGLSIDEKGAAALSAFVEVLAFAEFSESVPILASRYHMFLRAPEGMFLRFDTMRLTPERSFSQVAEDGSEVPVYEISACRHCGEAYVLGEVALTKDYSWLDPRKTDLDDDDNAARTYFRILSDAGEVDEAEIPMWLCPRCGSLHSDAMGGPHRFEHEKCDRLAIAQGKATETMARCGHCGYRHRYAIQPVRVSPEAAGSVACYDLVRDVPPFEEKKTDDDFDDLFGMEEDDKVRGGSIVCFSDRRQDAAFFAPALSSTYNRITARQIIREAVASLCREGGWCRTSDASRWIASALKSTYDMQESARTDIARKNEAEAWLYDELIAEDSRNSLAGLGVVEVAPEPLLALFDAKKPAFEQLASRDRASLPVFSWLRADDYITILSVCLETLREQGAIKRAEGISDLVTSHTKQTPVVKGGSNDAPRDTIRFIPMPQTSGNKRSNFVIAYSSAQHGANVTRAEADALLGILYEDLKRLLNTMSKREQIALAVTDSKTGGFLLSPDLWAWRPTTKESPQYLCDVCGCMLQYQTGGVCITRNCGGTARRVSFDEAFGKDRYYKETYRESPVPIRVEEHTAQLSTKRAASVQHDFIDGKVNVLSCTTTFELGVDVGDLRATFMRNVPPSPANYAQRAGRVGRRAGKPGFALTFARLRPHDIEYYRNPEKIIAGSTKPPFCYLDNPAIAIRHIYALVLSEFFRSSPEKEAYSDTYNDFLRISMVRPTGLDELAEFITANHERLTSAVGKLIPDDMRDDPAINLIDGAWIDGLVGDDGRLMQAHAIINDDWNRLEQTAETMKAENKYGRIGIIARQQEMLLKKRTISLLAESGVLPKYGFPTDLAQLSLMDQEDSMPEDRLDLSRGLRVAIREYAPGSEIVAGKRVWKSVGITKPRDRSYEIRRFGTCPNKDCRSFVVPIDTGDDKVRCPLCGETIRISNRMLVPSSGFKGIKLANNRASFRRPRNGGFVDIQFAQEWELGKGLEWLDYEGGKLGVRFAGNGRLYAINRGPQGSGFSVCSYCGAAAPAGETVSHERWCISKKTGHYTGLGTVFTTDVLELTFLLEKEPEGDKAPWRSLMWAIVQAAVSIMSIPDGEIGATTYTNFDHRATSVLLYDNTPGGAGRSLQLSNNVDELLRRAYELVSTCDCGEDSCCYGCLCNYFNQREQDKLSRGAAKRVLEALLFGAVGEE